MGISLIFVKKSWHFGTTTFASQTTSSFPRSTLRMSLMLCRFPWIEGTDARTFTPPLRSALWSIIRQTQEFSPGKKPEESTAGTTLIIGMSAEKFKEPQLVCQQG